MTVSSSGLVLLVYSLTTCITAHLYLASTGSTSGFPSLEEVRGNGSLLMNTAARIKAYESVFPDLTFTCNGKVTKWTFIALRGERSQGMQGNSLSQLKLLRMSSAEHPSLRTYYLTAPALNTGDAIPIPGSATGYELAAPHHQLPFQAGDVLGVSQQHSAEHLFRYQLRIRLEICRRSGGVGDNYYCEEDGDFGRPLVAVETEPAGCAQGFLDTAVLRHVMASTNVTARFGVVQYQQLQFTCSATVRKWIVGAKINGEGTTAPNVCLYRGSTGSPVCTPLLSLRATPYLNVYEYGLSPPVEVHPDDHVGFNQTHFSSQIYFQRYGLMPSTDLPLISVVFEGYVCPGGCTDGFIGLEKLKKQAQYIPNFVSSDMQEGLTLFPHMNISQDGYMVKWTFIADQGQGDEFPNLLILDSLSEDIIHLLNSSQSVPTDYPNVYEYTPHSPLPVEAGNFIAVEQPPKDSARLLLSFVRYAGPEGEAADVRAKRHVEPFHGKEGNLPLITLDVIASATEAITPSAVHRVPSAPPSTWTLNTVEHETGASQEDTSMAVIVGASVGGLVSVVTLSLLTLAIVCWRARARRTKATNACTLHNVPTSHNEAYGAIRAQQDMTQHDSTSTEPQTAPNVASSNGFLMTAPNEAYAPHVTPNEAYALHMTLNEAYAPHNEAYALHNVSMGHSEAMQGQQELQYVIAGGDGGCADYQLVCDEPPHTYDYILHQ